MTMQSDPPSISTPQPISPSQAGDRTSDGGSIRRKQILALCSLIFLVLIAAGLGIWKWESSREPDEPLVDTNRGFAGFGNRPPPREGVSKSGVGFEVRSGFAVMNVYPNGKDWRYGFSYRPGRFSSPDQPRYLTVRYQTTVLGMTDSQKKLVMALPPFSGQMVLDPADRTRLETLWTTYNADKKPATEKALNSALSEIGNKSLPATLAATDAYVAKVKAILTPEQIAKLATQPARGNRATTRVFTSPTSRPA